MHSFIDPIDNTLARLSARRGLCTCEPVSLAVLAGTMAAGGAASSIIGANTSRQMAKHQEDEKRNAQDQVILENRMRATHDYLRNVRLEQLKQQQETESLAEEGGDERRGRGRFRGDAGRHKGVVLLGADA